MDLKRARKRAGYTLRELEEAAGIHNTNISAMEAGRRSMGRRHAEKISEVLEVDELELRIESAKSRYNRAVETGDRAATVKAAHRVVELAEEAEETGDFTVDWSAVDEMLESVDKTVSKSRADSDPNADVGPEIERDAFGVRHNKSLMDDEPETIRGDHRDGHEAPDLDDLDEDDELPDRDATGRRTHKDF